MPQYIVKGSVRFYPCEFCGEFSVKSKDDTVCWTCDEKLIAEQSGLIPLKSHRKCRKCDKYLPLNRYFACEGCVTLETESEWDECDDPEDFDDRRICSAIAETRDKKFTGPKTCTLCKESKPRDKFPLNMGMKDGRLNQCLPCIVARNKARKQALKAAEVSNNAAQ